MTVMQDPPLTIAPAADELETRLEGHRSEI
ncbi:MAG: hypothetical protein QOJ47_1201, partial [Gaiellales bacterium]|nr:hypothetical protein [Gaiellales bacterium]